MMQLSHSTTALVVILPILAFILPIL